MMKRIIPLLLLAVVAAGCGSTGTEWVYPGAGWTVDVGHYDYPEKIRRIDAPEHVYYTAPDGYKILALWVIVTNHDKYSYTLRDDVSSWRVADGNNHWAGPFVRNFERVGALQTDEPFVHNTPRSGYMYFLVHEDFDVQTAMLEFRFYGLGQSHLVIVGLDDVQPLSNTI